MYETIFSAVNGQVVAIEYSILRRVSKNCLAVHDFDNSVNLICVHGYTPLYFGPWKMSVFPMLQVLPSKCTSHI